MSERGSCSACRNGEAFSGAITMAFQPIVDAAERTVFAHEALVRGVDGATAEAVLSAVDTSNHYAFDQMCRVKALECAVDAELPALVSINFLPNAVYNPEHCLRTTLAAAKRLNWPLSRVIFEVTEHEAVVDHRHLLSILQTYRAQGFLTAIDDFGAGYAGLNLLADFQPDVLKLDMGLVRSIDTNRVRQRIVGRISQLCDDLGVRVVGEGVETAEESLALCDLGIALQQGFFFARPATGRAPVPVFPA